MVEDFCAERVEPAPELSVNKQTATLALKRVKESEQPSGC